MGVLTISCIRRSSGGPQRRSAKGGWTREEVGSIISCKIGRFRVQQIQEAESFICSTGRGAYESSARIWWEAMEEDRYVTNLCISFAFERRSSVHVNMNSQIFKLQGQMPMFQEDVGGVVDPSLSTPQSTLLNIQAGQLIGKLRLNSRKLA